MLAATLSTDEAVTLNRVPQIRDVQTMRQLLGDVLPTNEDMAASREPGA